MSLFNDLCSEGERIWAGVDGVYGAMSLLEPVPTARGSLCYYKSREGEDKWRDAETFKWVVSYDVRWEASKQGDVIL